MAEWRAGLESLAMETVLHAPDTVRSQPDVSHWVQQEAPETVNTMLLTWLSGHDVPEAAEITFERLDDPACQPGRMWVRFAELEPTYVFSYPLNSCSHARRPGRRVCARSINAQHCAAPISAERAVSSPGSSLPSMEDGPDDDRRSPGPGGNTTETMIAELRTQLRHTVAMDGQEVLDRLSRGLNEREVLADIEYPSEMFDLPWLTPLYGCPGYIMGDLVREESGRWDRNPNSLHPSPQDEVVRATFDAIDDPDDEPSVVSARAIKGLHKSSRLLLEKGTLAREGVAP